MTSSQIKERMNKLNEEILDLQDIVFEENIPQSERSDFVGVCWHTPEQLANAKKRIAELNQELEELGNQENLLRATRMWF